MSGSKKKIPSWFPKPSEWYKLDMNFLGCTERWYGRVMLNQARAKELLALFPKDNQADRDIRAKALAAMVADVKAGLFLDSNCIIRFANRMERGGEMMRVDGQYTLNMIANNDFGRDFSVAIQICDIPDEATFRKMILATEFRTPRNTHEIVKTATEGSKEFNGVARCNRGILNGGYVNFCSNFVVPDDKSYKNSCRKHNTIRFMDNADVIAEVNKYIGTVGGNSPIRHVQRILPISLLFWIQNKHHSSLAKFGHAISTGEGGVSGDGAMAYRDFLLKKTKDKNESRRVNLETQKNSRHNYELLAGMYAFALWKLGRRGVSALNIEFFMEAIGTVAPMRLEEEIARWIKGEAPAVFYSRKPNSIRQRRKAA